MNITKWLETMFRKPDKTNDYPETVAEVLDDNIKYRVGVQEAILKFKSAKPWDGNMKEKLLQLNTDLAKVYGIEAPQVVFVKRFVHGCCYFPIGNLIIMEQEKDGRFSVITYLHEFGHALGKGEKATCRWSINLFRKFFPKSFSRLVPKGHLLYLPKEVKDDVADEPKH